MSVDAGLMLHDRPSRRFHPYCTKKPWQFPARAALPKV